MNRNRWAYVHEQKHVDPHEQKHVVPHEQKHEEGKFYLK